MATSDELLDLERRGWDALSEGGDGGRFYDEVLDDRPVMLLPGGMVLTERAAMIDAMSGQPWSAYELDNLRVTELTNDAAVVSYGVIARRDPGFEYSALLSSTYVRRPDGWKLAFHQQTPR
jgi:hypothetical protein